MEWEFNRVSRRNQERTLTIEAKHETFKAPELFDAITPLADKLQLEDAYHWEVGCEIEGSAETMEKLFRYLPACFSPGLDCYEIIIYKCVSIDSVNQILKKRDLPIQDQAVID